MRDGETKVSKTVNGNNIRFKTRYRNDVMQGLHCEYRAPRQARRDKREVYCE